MPPPSCAKSATSDAPKPNPTSSYGVCCGLCSPPNARKSTPTPSSDSPTTTNPVTAPPRSAICNARPRLVRAAAAVRIFARIETHIPVWPEMADHDLPRVRPRIGRNLISEEERNRQPHRDQCYRTVLPAHKSLGALANGIRDALHLRRPRVGPQHAAPKQIGGEQAKHSGCKRD